MNNLEEVFKPKWELAEFTDLDSARSFALSHGWKQKKVQIRQLGFNKYSVEPYEDCGCPNIIPVF